MEDELSGLRDRDRDYSQLLARHRTLENEFETLREAHSELKVKQVERETRISELETANASLEISEGSSKRENTHLQKRLKEEEERVASLSQEVGELGSLKKINSSLQDNVKELERKVSYLTETKERELRRLHEDLENANQAKLVRAEE